MNNEQDFGVSQIIRGRAAFYEFLSYTLQKPMDKDALEIIKEFAPYFEAVAAETDVADLKEGSSRLTSFIAKSDDNGAFYDMLNGSYSTLFLLGGKSIPTTESVWLSPEKLEKQEPWSAVLELYDEEELGIPADFKESEDHIAIELLFMFHLAKKCADELDENNDDEADALMGLQHHFLNEHLMQWAPNFAGAVIDMCEAKNLLLYDAIAYLVRGFLVYDKGFMDMILADEEEG